MRTIIIYSSKHSVTKKYAYLIQEKLNCDVVEDKYFDINDFVNYDAIIFGNYIHSGKIKGFKLINDNFSKIKNKKLFLFFVGIDDTCNNINNAIDNHLSTEMKKKLYISFFRGSYNYECLSFLDKTTAFLMMKFKKEHFKNEISSIKNIFDYVESIYVDNFVSAVLTLTLNWF